MTTTWSEDLPPLIEARLSSIVAAPTEEQDAELEALCRDYPEHAEQIRERIAAIHLMRDQLAELCEAIDEVPERIGPYRILEQLGEGGFGTVFLAERREPFRMRVAVKVVKLGMDTKYVLQRFQVERQALALMEHDNIAKVLDAGATEQGRPYFVMEYVKGEPITKYCDDQRLSLNERLEIFTQVCAGVQHAHQKGVLHRDLTRNNVLVTVRDSTPVPKIIDFGLARALSGRLIEQTVYTELGRFAGTPEYMSPEQASYGRLDVDARTDVYSLGVLLFELLTGSPPLRRARGEGLQEIRDRIANVEPPKPSTRVTTLDGSERLDVARRRRIATRDHRRRLAGDLDWIAMKALAKDRTRRYESPAALADDVRRHLDHRPVEAGPPALGYQLGKLVRRYRGRFAAAGAVLLALVAGAVGISIFAVKESKARADYEKLLDTARVESLQHVAGQVHPPRRSRVAQLESLVALAEDLVAKISEVDRVMSELSAGHVLAQAAARSPDRGPHPESAELTHLEGMLVELDRELGSSRTTDSERRLGEPMRRDFAAERDAIRRRIEHSNRIAIPVPRDRLLHDRFERQRVDLCRVRDELLPDLRFRLDWAKTVRARTTDDHTEAWAAVRARMSSNPKYEGVDLEPQVGLVPIGQDPISKLEEFGHLMSGSPTSRGGDGKLSVRSKTGLVFVLVPRGTVKVGDHNRLSAEERARYQATTVDALFVSKFEMNRLQWQRLARNVRGLRLYQDGNADLRNLSGPQLSKPVNHVTWWQCEQLLRRAGLSIPSQAQWEYSCKAGTETVWYTGNSVRSLGAAAKESQSWVKGCAANYKDGLHRYSQSTEIPYFDGVTETQLRPTLAPAHLPLRPNAFGLHHMHGNVAEWCNDAQPGRHKARVLRGGSCNTPPFRGYSADDREWAMPTDAGSDIGLRPIRPVDS